MDSPTNQHDFALPGYKLSDRLGEGGYGEVWRAEAPGGLIKAVKIVFGNYRDKRAVDELRALERIKEVRHPFLLSLERIEVIEGRLIIVTELADGSLKDRFDQCLQAGLPGIARDELLGFMRDAADALDYLSNQYSLQHLDVKPENLLLVGGHVKVADFGLVKDVQNTQASLVGGLTPLYSAPEVFQGNPGVYSDQYSLAVLYQEMLTGCMPFPGSTAAELTLQHLHEEPTLLPLPTSDRYIVARALSKNPQQRYSSCSEMVEALRGNHQSAFGASSQASDSPAAKPLAEESPQTFTKRPPRAVSVTQFCDDESEATTDDSTNSILFDIPELRDKSVTTLPPLEVPTNPFKPSPVLIIGIGGTACSVLRHCRQQLSKRFGEADNVPAIQTLLLDTDSKALRTATQGNGDDVLQAEQTLSLALRRPQEYRKQSDNLLRWLGRRWLYNIPRSLQTEGLRPLGRLAFVDHARQAIQRIRMALAQAVDAESIKASSGQTQLAFRSDAVRVYVVASISGGTGSGISLDIGYAVRHLLAKLGIANAKTVGLMAFSTGRESRQCDLAKVNAYSWLSEWNHFSRPEGCFPGDQACGLPASEPGTPPFDSTYLVHLGEGLDRDHFEQATEQMARYLILDALSPAQVFLDACRNESTTQGSSLPELRTFGLHQQTAASQNLMEGISAKLCHSVVLGWKGAATGASAPEAPQSINDILSLDLSSRETETTSESDTNQLVHGAPQLVAQLQLSLEQLAATNRSLILEKFGGNVEALLQKLVHDSSAAGKPASLLEMMQVVDNLFTPPPGPPEANHAPDQDIPYVLGRPLKTVVSPLGMKLAGDLRCWILNKLDAPEERLSGAQNATAWFSGHMQSVSEDARKLSTGIGRQLAKSTATISEEQDDAAANPNRNAPEIALNRVLLYFHLQLDQSALQATYQLARMLHAELKTTNEALTEFGRHLSHLAESLVQDSELPVGETSGEQDASPSDNVANTLLNLLPELATTVNTQLLTELIHEQGGLFATVMSHGRVRNELMVQLKTNSLRLVDKAVREIDFTSDLLQNNGSDDASSNHSFAQAMPKLLEFGGQSRQIAILPQSNWTAEELTLLAKQLGPNTSLVEGGDDALVTCCEASQLPLTHIAAQLIQHRRDYVEFANRVHTRSDITWTPLTDTTTNSVLHSEPVAVQM